VECIEGLGGKDRRKEFTRKLGHRWKDNVKMDHRKIG
jgi:hypothetical protein